MISSLFSKEYPTLEEGHPLFRQFALGNPAQYCWIYHNFHILITVSVPTCLCAFTDTDRCLPVGEGLGRPPRD